MSDITQIKFDQNGLVPAIVCDAYTNRVLMQAYMNREALQKTLETGQAHYYSRSRAKLWRKGETSGHTQAVVSVAADCDYDSILLRVIQTGPACHTNAPSCFFNQLVEVSSVADVGILLDTQDAICDRKNNPQEGSYTNYLFDKGREKICKKLAEESGEAIIAAMKGDNAELCEEAADLLYHLLVLLNERGTDFSSVLQVLKTRRENERKRAY